MLYSLFMTLAIIRLFYFLSYPIHKIEVNGTQANMVILFSTLAYVVCGRASDLRHLVLVKKINTLDIGVIN